jgi:hypothetical protein
MTINFNNFDREKIRPFCVGGISKERLLASLYETHIQLNDAAKTLFASDLFVVSGTRRYLHTIEVAVVDLDFSEGATMPEIQKMAQENGLVLPPLELGPHMRLQYLDQIEGSIGHQKTKNQAPPESLTIASAPICENHEFPKGFYLRRIEGILWLRGYRDDLEHIYNPRDRLIFCMP